MSGERDRGVLDRLEKLESKQEKTDALINKGKGFWLAIILIGSAAAAGLTTLWEVLKHWRGVAGS